jgi:hypothetical protein
MIVSFIRGHFPRHVRTHFIPFSFFMSDITYESPFFQNCLGYCPHLTCCRPGFGGSTPVELSQRIPTFLEIIPLLLLHLGIKSISIASQSAGTIYGLNLLAHRPDLLSPSNPRVTFFSPWVHQTHSSVAFLKLASMLPNGLLNHWNKLTGFIINNAQPAFAVSGGAVTAASSAFRSKTASQEREEELARECLQGYGIPLALKEEVDKLIFKYGFQESTTGANDEARLCLKSVAGIGWDTCEDYEQYVSVLSGVWGKRLEEGRPKLRISIVLPEEDIMVGEKGMAYFENCWAKERYGKGIEVEITKLEGADHDSTASPPAGAVGRMFAEVKGPAPRL